MIDNNTIRQVLHINECNKKRLRLNDKYICEFADSYYFSEFAKDNNCSRSTCYADVIAYDDSRFRKLMNGKVYISHDADLGVNGLYSMSLQFEDNGVKSIVTVTDCAVEDARVQVKDFMKLIDFKPSYDVSEPYDNLGLTVCTFEKHNGFEPNIEFGMNGKLYYELLDMNDYEEGSVIALNSPCRKDVISYVKLTSENMNELANKINASLHNTYDNKKEQ